MELWAPRKAQNPAKSLSRRTGSMKWNPPCGDHEFICNPAKVGSIPLEEARKITTGSRHAIATDLYIYLRPDDGRAALPFPCPHPACAAARAPTRSRRCSGRARRQPPPAAAAGGVGLRAAAEEH